MALFLQLLAAPEGDVAQDLQVVGGGILLVQMAAQFQGVLQTPFFDGKVNRCGSGTELLAKERKLVL